MTRDWLYLRIYPGALEKMDALARLVARPAVKLARGLSGVDRWFFLRYVDQRGYHLRLRFRGPTRSINVLHRELEHLVASALMDIADLKVPATKRLVPLPIPDLSSDEIGWETDLYEPELNVYGEGSGIETAEITFEQSSELALSLLLDERWRHGSRVGYALALMGATADAFHIQDGREMFWARYAAFWSRPEYGSTQALADRLASAAAVRTLVVGRDYSATAKLSGWRVLISEYVKALEGSVAGGKLLVPEQRCAQFVHLMNNRLGFLPIEEVYMAFLLRAWEKYEAAVGGIA